MKLCEIINAIMSVSLQRSDDGPWYTQTQHTDAKQTSKDEGYEGERTVPE